MFANLIFLHLKTRIYLADFLPGEPLIHRAGIDVLNMGKSPVFVQGLTVTGLNRYKNAPEYSRAVNKIRKW